MQTVYALRLRGQVRGLPKLDPIPFRVGGPAEPFEIVAFAFAVDGRASSDALRRATGSVFAPIRAKNASLPWVHGHERQSDPLAERRALGTALFGGLFVAGKATS